MADTNVGVKNVNEINFGVMLATNNMYRILTNSYGNYFSVDTLDELDEKVDELLDLYKKSDIFPFKGISMTVDATLEENTDATTE